MGHIQVISDIECSKTVNSVFQQLLFQLVDLGNTDKIPVEVAAHEGPIACIAINLEGTLVATASERGTLIRVFETAAGAKVKEFRRGTNHVNGCLILASCKLFITFYFQATIYSIHFDKEATRLCVASDHDTVHIFNLNINQGKKNGESSSGLSLSGLSIIPKYFSSQYSFCKITVPPSGPFICAFGSEADTVISKYSRVFYYF